MRSIVLLVASCALVLGATTAASMAADNDCKLECQRQYQQDKRDCRARDHDGEAQRVRRFDACLRAATDRPGLRTCSLDTVRDERLLARASQFCSRLAKQRRDACRADCDPSPTLP